MIDSATGGRPRESDRGRLTTRRRHCRGAFLRSRTAIAAGVHCHVMHEGESQQLQTRQSKNRHAFTLEVAAVVQLGLLLRLAGICRIATRHRAGVELDLWFESLACTARWSQVWR